MPSHATLLELLTEAARTLNRHSDTGELLRAMVDLCMEAVRPDACFIYLYEGQELVLRASSNAHPDELGQLRMRLGEGITGWVAQQRRPVALAEKASADARFKLYSTLPEDRYEAFLSVPILFRDRVLGVINLQHREVHAHSPEEIKAVQALGLTIGEVLERKSEAKARRALERRLATVAEFHRWLAETPGATGAPACEKIATALGVERVHLTLDNEAPAPGRLLLPLRSRNTELGALRVDFDPAHPPDTELAAMLAELLGTATEAEQWRADAARQAAALAERKLVERAKGLLQQQRRLSEPDAYRWLQQESRRTRRSMAEVAQSLLEGGGAGAK